MKTAQGSRSTPRRARHHEGLAWLFATVLLVTVFSLWPELDLAVSTLAYAGAGLFPANDWWPVRIVYRGTPWLGTALVLLAAAVLLVAGLRRASVGRRLWRRAALLLLCAVLGVGLVVHEALKDHWGRPRPNQVQAFGGVHGFRAALQPSHDCRRNCSFVSGHAATGFALMSLGALGPVRTRRRYWRLATSAGLLIGAVRVLQGGHFLSDVLFCLVVIWASNWLVREAWLRITLWRRQGRSRRCHAAVTPHSRDIHAPFTAIGDAGHPCCKGQTRTMQDYRAASTR